jgi:hypothetical protein
MPRLPFSQEDAEENAGRDDVQVLENLIARRVYIDEDVVLQAGSLCLAC